MLININSNSILINVGTIFKCMQLLNLLKLVSTTNCSHKLFIINFYNICKMEIEKLQVDR